MMIKALIVEQLEVDGTIRSFRMQPADGREDLVVAFPDEYEEHRSGPFHFHDPRDAQRYTEGFARCVARTIGRDYFYREGDMYHVESTWAGIPTERNWLSYYALVLPEDATPRSLSIRDPHSGREYERRVTRDDPRRRYVIFLKCSSSLGKFDFELTCDFIVDRSTFSQSEYRDPQTEERESLGDEWKDLLNENEGDKVQQFFVRSMQLGDVYHTGQAGAVGPKSLAHDMTFQQIWNQTGSDLDLDELARELGQLRQALAAQVSSADHGIALGQIASAEAAATKKDGPSVLRHLQSAGKWVLDSAKTVGLDLATKAIEKALGM